jgi:TetR/AcrR family transcriptional regulator, fatty acid metabolism regulator protein
MIDHNVVWSSVVADTASGKGTTMTARYSAHRASREERGKGFPPGRIKITAALKSLLEEKEFSAITTAEIARTAGVTEALIYKYFTDKRDLLHQVLAEYLDFFITRAETDVKGIRGALHKLRKLIWSHVTMYAQNKVLARILVVEVRNYPDYFNSNAYQMVRRYTGFLKALIEEGVQEGSIRNDVSTEVMRQTILGAIEHLCLPSVLFQRDLDPDQISEQLCDLIFAGIARSEPQGGGRPGPENDKGSGSGL